MTTPAFLIVSQFAVNSQSIRQKNWRFIFFVLKKKLTRFFDHICFSQLYIMNFKDCKTLNVYDDYYTPEWVWKKIEHFVPKNKIIWEACMLNATNSKSMDIWRDMGYEVVGSTEWDILDCDIPKCDIIITNIPFETKIKQKILQRLMDLDIPFIIIMSGLNIFSNYFQDIMNLEHTQIIYPRGKLHYHKNGEEEVRKTVFYSVFVAYKMNIENPWCH